MRVHTHCLAFRGFPLALSVVSEVKTVRGQPARSPVETRERCKSSGPGSSGAPIPPAGPTARMPFCGAFDRVRSASPRPFRQRHAGLPEQKTGRGHGLVSTLLESLTHSPCQSSQHSYSGGDAVSLAQEAAGVDAYKARLSERLGFRRMSPKIYDAGLLHCLRTRVEGHQRIPVEAVGGVRIRVQFVIRSLADSSQDLRQRRRVSS